jgi:RNAse (barnase) inhibitor barstar
MSKFKLPELKKKNLDTDYKPYQMDDETKELHALVTQRFSAMKTYRNNFDKSWDTYNDMIEAIFKPY